MKVYNPCDGVRFLTVEGLSVCESASVNNIDTNTAGNNNSLQCHRRAYQHEVLL